MIDRMLQRYGVGTALALLVCELTYINAKSLHFLVQGMDYIDTVFGVIGAIAYSMVTILVMRLSRRQWLKVVFPIFDIALVLLGFNLRFADDLLGNPVRFWLTVFVALFTGLITYSLGQINADQHADESRTKDIQRIQELSDRLAQRERYNAEITQKHAESSRKLSETQRNLEVIKRNLDETTSKYDETNRKLNETMHELADTKLRLGETKSLQERNEYLEGVTRELLRSHILYEAWLATKRRKTSRRDSELIRLAELIRQGQSVALADYERIEMLE